MPRTLRTVGAAAIAMLALATARPGTAGAQPLTNPSCTALGASNLVRNCSFEAPGIGTGGWRWTSNITDWTSSSGYFEQWYGESGFKSREGRAHLELDVDGNGGGSGMVMNTTVWQALQTKVGARYNVFYSASHRASGNGVSKVGVLLDFDGSASGAATLVHDTGANLTQSLKWVDFGFSFVATGTETLIGFRAMGTPNEYGDHLDNIGVVAVPEPSAFALMGAGLLALGVVARRRRVS